MKNYLLTVIGNIDSDKICENIAISLSPIVDSPHMKFKYKKGILLFHFASDVYKDELYEFIVGELFGISESFILTEINDNVSVFMNEKLKKHLFDLENIGEEVTMNIDMSQIKNNTGVFEDEEDDDDFVALLLGEKEKIFKRPTLDQLLDKIISKGYQSLTPFEQDVLEYYSKN
jgi:hypothetical protein